jgi:predicted enzyme related to lactoylglutathione lyase
MTSYEPATPCWVDLSSPDPVASAAFYSRLFSWQAEVTLGPETDGYRLFTRGGAAASPAVAAVLPLTSEGQQPAWTTYVSVTDVVATVKAVEAAGGQVLTGPIDVSDQGRMVIFTDPAGAVIAAWQPWQFQGAALVGDHDTYCWSELVCRDVDGAKAFYGEVFGWQGDTRPFGPSSYTEWKIGGRPVAGMAQMNEQWPAEISPHWMVYFSVDDCDVCVTRVAELGGTVSVRPTDIPTGRIAVLSDPHGAFFAVIRLGA